MGEAIGEEKAWKNKTGIYLGAAAAAEFIADIFLCPLEAVRIRSVSDPEFCDGLAHGSTKMLKADGVGGFYAGFLPILAKQVPYTMAKFAVQERLLILYMPPWARLLLNFPAPPISGSL